MILTTTQGIEGYQTSQYLRIVSAEAISGISLFKDFGTGFHNFVGDRSETYERELGMTRETALTELYQRAEAMGAGAVVGANIDYEILSVDNGVLMVTASGITVTLAQVIAVVSKSWSEARAPSALS